MEVVASLSQGRTVAAQCGLFTHKSAPVIFEPPCMCQKAMIFRKLVSIGKKKSSTLKNVMIRCEYTVSRTAAGKKFFIGDGET